PAPVLRARAEEGVAAGAGLSERRLAAQAVALQETAVDLAVGAGRVVGPGPRLHGVEGGAGDDLAALPASAGGVKAGEDVHVRDAEPQPALRREGEAVVADPVIGLGKARGVGRAREG